MHRFMYVASLEQVAYVGLAFSYDCLFTVASCEVGVVDCIFECHCVCSKLWQQMLKCPCGFCVKKYVQSLSRRFRSLNLICMRVDCGRSDLEKDCFTGQAVDHLVLTQCLFQLMYMEIFCFHEHWLY